MILNRFLIVLLSSLLALAIIVNAHNHNEHNEHNKHKTCTVTKTSKHTVTVIKSCGSHPTHFTNNNCHHNRKNNCHNCRKTKTVTCTPTTTKCSTPAPTPTCCQAPGAPGWGASVHSGNDPSKVVPTPEEDPQACCKSCLKEPRCTQWVFLPGTCFRHFDSSEVCPNPLFNFGTNSGIVRCSDGCKL